METIRLVQLVHPAQGRRVALVREPQLVLLHGDVDAVYTLAHRALDEGIPIQRLVEEALTTALLDYELIYQGESPWQLLPAFDHPGNPFACLVSGTGLTHHSSAKNRQMMHLKETDKLTDSMKMYQWGVEGGHPVEGQVGVQPEWFYKGTGHVLKAHGQPLALPTYADDGGEEPEIAGAYIIDQDGVPVRIGFCNGNEFSDHVMEGKNYLYLAPSKLRNCSIGPELVIGASFEGFSGSVSIVRNGKPLWQQDIQSGQANMAHSLANLEYHHFKYQTHRIPGQAHVHFFGADAFSYGEQVALVEADSMVVSWKDLGRPLINTLKKSVQANRLTMLRDIAAL